MSGHEGADIQRKGDEAYEEQRREIDKQRSEAETEARRHKQKNLDDIARQEHAKLAEINREIANVPWGYSVDERSVQRARDDIRQQVASARANIDRNAAENLQRIAKETSRVLGCPPPPHH